jgi:hypothetical protein
MGKQTVLAKKRRGPAPTGKGVQVVVRLQPDPLSALDKWAARQADKPTRAEAIRRLVERGLTGKTKARPSAALVADLAADAIDSLGPKVKAPARPVGKRLRAQELAAKTIEKIIDSAAPPEERTERKRRLTKGPAEFRDARVDQAKGK